LLKYEQVCIGFGERYDSIGWALVVMNIGSCAVNIRNVLSKRKGSLLVDPIIDSAEENYQDYEMIVGSNNKRGFAFRINFCKEPKSLEDLRDKFSRRIDDIEENDSLDAKQKNQMIASELRELKLKADDILRTVFHQLKG